MPAAVALLLCAAFIAFLLRNEQKRSGSVSRNSWVPTLWMLYFASKPVGRWMDPTGEIEDSAADRFFLIALICLGWTTLIKKKFDWAGQIRRNRWLMVLVGYMLVSCVWSDVPFGSFKQWVRVFGSCIMAFVVLTEPEPTRALQSIFIRTTYILIPLSVVLVKYFPDLGVEYRPWNGEKFWVGASMQKNGLARLCMVCALFICWTLLWDRKRGIKTAWKYATHVHVLILVMIAWLLKGPESNYPMTAIAVVVLCTVLMIGLLNLNRTLASRLSSGLGVFTLAVALAMACMSVTGVIPSFGTDAMGRDATFTGRTFIWEGVRKVAWSSPLIGVGYSGYWDKPHEFPHVGRVNEGHNGYLDVFVETGMLGLILLSFVFVSYAGKTKQERVNDFGWASFRIVFLLMLVLHNFTETSLLRSSTHLWCLFIYMYVIFSKNKSHRIGMEGKTRLSGAAKMEQPDFVTA